MAIEAELKGLKKINKKDDPLVSTRLKQMIRVLAALVIFSRGGLESKPRPLYQSNT